MALLTISTWAELVKAVSSSPIGSELLKANNYTAFEDLLLKEGAKHGITMAQNTLAKGAEVATDSSIMTYTSYATEGLTGGVSTATQVATLAETETGVTATTVGASAGAVSVGAIVGGIIGGLGLGLVAYELTPEFWTGLSNVIFGTNIQYDNIKDYSIMTLFKNNKTYVPDEVVQKVSDYLNTIGAYNTNTVINNNIADFEVGQTKDFLTLNFNESVFTTIINQAYSKFPYTSGSPDLRLLANQFWTKLISVCNPSDFNCVSIRIIIPQNAYWCSININCYNVLDENLTIISKCVNNTDVGYLCKINNSIAPQIYNNIKLGWAPNYDNKVILEHRSASNQDMYVGKYVDYTNCIYETSNINSTMEDMIAYNGLKKSQGSVLPVENEPLNVTFPSWYQNALTIGGIKPDKSGLQQIQYLPIELPTINPMTTDLAIPQAQAQLGDVTTTPQQQALLDALARIQQSIPNYPYIQSPPSTDVGNTPSTPTVLPSASASGLISIYNPTLSEVNGLGGYLWSANFVDQILKLFQNPMDAIIGLHILYGTPSISGRGHIKVGYLDTGIESNLVNNQYITVDCGTIQVSEQNGNATDYPPFTRTSLYLPFIGIVELNGYDIIGGYINIEYKIDVLTGCCLANVSINKNSSNAILYTYNGNCAVQLPLTGGNYASMISGLIGVGLGAMTGGVGMAVAGVMGAVSHGATVQHSGCLGSNSGAMGIKKPYLIVTRFIPYDAVNYNNYYGYPSNNTYKISDLTGYTKVKEIRLNGINATNKEKMELETILKNGVIF